MATCWESAAHSVNRMFSVLCLFVAFSIRERDIGSDYVSIWSFLTFYFSLCQSRLRHVDTRVFSAIQISRDNVSYHKIFFAMTTKMLILN